MEKLKPLKYRCCLTSPEYIFSRIIFGDSGYSRLCTNVLKNNCISHNYFSFGFRYEYITQLFIYRSFRRICSRWSHRRRLCISYLHVYCLFKYTFQIHHLPLEASLVGNPNDSLYSLRCDLSRVPLSNFYRWIRFCHTSFTRSETSSAKIITTAAFWEKEIKMTREFS
jgi:hypothetical protein